MSTPKRIFLLMLSWCLLLAALAACRSREEEETTDDVPSTQEVTVSVTEETATGECVTFEPEAGAENVTEESAAESETTGEAPTTEHPTTEAPTAERETATDEAGLTPPEVNTETGWGNFRPVG